MSNTSRYDLPSSRILIRSLRYRDARVEALIGKDPGTAAREEMENRLLSIVLDMYTLRLLEDRNVLPGNFLRGGKRAGELVASTAAAKIEELNDWLGWKMFDAEAWRDPGPGEQLETLDREMHLSRFWPPGIGVEILGALWEERLPVIKRSGIFYTPRKIVKLIMDNCLHSLLDEGNMDELLVLDPACGAGYFVIEAYRRLAARELGMYRSANELFSPTVRGESGRRVLDPARRMELIRDHLFGLDLDEMALGLMRRTLMIEVLADTAALRYAPPSEAPLFENFKEGDAILERSFPQQVDLFDQGTPPPLKPFDWWDEAEGFGKILHKRGFTCIIGNPPWVSLKGRHRQAPYAPEVVSHLIEKYNADTYRPNIVEFFIRRGIELLEDGGWMSFVVPDRIAENEQFDSLRNFMAEHGEIVRLHFREPFPGVAADTLIYVYQKRKRPRRTAKILVTDASGLKKKVGQAFWIKGESGAATSETPDEIEEILRKIEAAGRRKLSDFMETGVGFIAKPRRITADRRDDTQRPVIKGEHVTPYNRSGSNWFEFTLNNLAGGTRNISKLSKKERILLRKTGARLMATIDTSGDLPEQSLYFAFARDRRLAKPYDLRFFLGILNSRIMSFYFRHRKITNRSTTPQIKKIHLDTLPIRPVNFNDPGVKALHDGLVEAVSRREAAQGEAEKLGLDGEIDLRVAELYGLEDKDVNKIGEELGKGWP